MRTKQLLKALQFHRETKDIFLGVYARNTLPRTIPRRKKVALIVNTDPADKPGQHWCAFYFTPTCVYFFDSYGNPPHTKSFHRLMQCRRYRKVFGRRIQGNARVCGHYCMYFILAMARNRGFSCFGDHFNANDRIVRKIVTDHFPVT